MPNRFFSLGITLLLLSLVSVLVSCSSQDGVSDIDESTTTSTTTATTPPTTTPFRYSYSSDPQETLDQLASIQGALDQSKISIACGIPNALIVEPTGIRYLRWSDSAWVEHFEFPSAGAIDAAYVVTTRDYTGDGLLDFLVGFRYDAPYGGILSPYGATCNWRWLTFTFPEGGDSFLIDSLNWSDETRVLSGINKSGLSPTTNLRFVFNDTTLEFVGQEDPYNDPDMSWIGDACESEKRLFPQLFEVSTISDANDPIGQAPTRIDYYDGEVALQVVSDWRDAIQDAVNALTTVGPQALNLTSKEVFYLYELSAPKLGSYYGGGWILDLDRATFAHDQLAKYCDMLPPRL